MSRVLTQDEIDALMTMKAHPQGGGASRVSTDAGTAAVRYNFRRPERVSREQIHSLQYLHDRFARNVATSLSAYLRSMTEMSVVSVEQFSYSEFLMSLTDPTAFYALAMPPFEELGALEINPAIAFTLVDRMLGGTGNGTPPPRALSDIEQNVIDSVVKLLLDALAESWRPIVNVAFGVRGRETRPQMLQVAAPNEVVIMIVFDMKIGTTRGSMNLCIPASVIESAGGHFAQAWHRRRREPTDTERRWVRDNLSRVPLQVLAQLQTRLSARELMALRPGDVLSLGVHIEEPVDLKVGNTRKYRGHLVKTRDRVGVRIAQRAMAGVFED